MVLINEFRVWCTQFLHRTEEIDEELNSRVKANDRSTQTAILSTIVIENRINLTSAPIEETLSLLKARCRSKQEYVAVDELNKSFNNVYWRDWLKHGRDYFDKASLSSGKSYEKFTKEFQRQFRFRNLFSIKAWKTYIEPCTGVSRARYGALAELQEYVDSGVTMDSLPDNVLSREYQIFMALPPTHKLVNVLKPMTTVMEDNRKLRELGIENLKKECFIRTHCVKRIESITTFIDSYEPALSNANDILNQDDKGVAQDILTRYLQPLIELVEVASFNDLSALFQSHLADINNERDTLTQGCPPARHRERWVEISKRFISDMTNVLAEELPEQMLAYYREQVVACAELSDSLKSSNVKAIDIEELIQALSSVFTQSMANVQARTTKKKKDDIEVDVEAKYDDDDDDEKEREEKVEEGGYKRDFQTLSLHDMNMDLLGVKEAIIQEAIEILNTNKPSVMAVLMSSESVTTCRTMLKDHLTSRLARMEYKRDILPLYWKLKDQFNSLSMQVSDTIKPALSQFKKTRQSHIPRYKAIQRRLEVMCELWLRQVDNYKPFNNQGLDSCILPNSWATKLITLEGEDASKDVPFGVFATKLHELHIQELKRTIY